MIHFDKFATVSKLTVGVNMGVYILNYFKTNPNKFIFDKLLLLLEVLSLQLTTTGQSLKSDIVIYMNKVLPSSEI